MVLAEPSEKASCAAPAEHVAQIRPSALVKGYPKMRSGFREGSGFQVAQVDVLLAGLHDFPLWNMRRYKTPWACELF